MDPVLYVSIVKGRLERSSAYGAGVHTSVPNLFSRVSPSSFLLMSLATIPAILCDVCGLPGRNFRYFCRHDADGSADGFICSMRQSRLFFGRAVGWCVVGSARPRLFQEALRRCYSVFMDAKRDRTKLLGSFVLLVVDCPYWERKDFKKKLNGLS